MRYARPADQTNRCAVGVEPQSWGAIRVSDEDHDPQLEVDDLVQLQELIHLLTDAAEILGWDADSLTARRGPET